MNTYYIAKPGAQDPIGPMTLEDIRQGIQQGTINREWSYIKTGMKEWLPIYALSALMQRSPRLTPNQFVTNANGTRSVCNNQFTDMPSCIPPHPGSGLAASILLTIFFGPLGIPAIVMSARCNALYNNGKYEAAARAAKSSTIYRLCVLSIPLILLVILMISLNS